MTNIRVQQLIEKIEQNMINIHNADRRTQNRLHAENVAIQQAIVAPFPSWWNPTGTTAVCYRRAGDK